MKKEKEIDLEWERTDSYLKGVCRERKRLMGIICYILDKNTIFNKDSWDDTVDYKKLYEDIREFNWYLSRRVRDSQDD
jgi:hypothetical protein